MSTDRAIITDDLGVEELGVNLSADEPSTPSSEEPTCALFLRDGALAYGARTLWSELSFAVAAGEFVAILGPNGAGKTSLLRVLLGLTPLSAGRLQIGGRRVRSGSRQIGYVPQQQALSSAAGIRARDLVRLGVDGDRWALRRVPRAERRVDELLSAVGATAYADAPLGMLSGGEQQRIRIAQALATEPAILLCDEPLLSLDLNHQRAVVELLDARRRTHRTAVVLVTHEINPILGVVDRVLFLGPQGHRMGTPEQILTSPVLTELYGTPVQVLRTDHGLAILSAAAGRV
ncbi:MAG: metal ABC transporter ATP-binding protein [Sporichthyaceae bacterium]